MLILRAGQRRDDLARAVVPCEAGSVLCRALLIVGNVREDVTERGRCIDRICDRKTDAAQWLGLTLDLE